MINPGVNAALSPEFDGLMTLPCRMTCADPKTTHRTIVVILACLCIVGSGPVRAAGRSTWQESPTQTEPPKVAEARKLAQSYKLKDTQGLLSLLKDPDERVRAAAAEGLGFILFNYGPGGGWMSADDPIQGLEQAFQHKIIDPFKVAGYRSALINALRDSSPRVRAAAVRTLAVIFRGGHGPADVNRAVVPLLRDPDQKVICAAVDAVPDLRDLDAVPDLITLLQHPSHDVRHAAAASLSRMPDRRANAPLLSGLKDPDPAVRSAVAGALASACYGGLTDSSIREPMLDALQDRQTRAGAVRCLMLIDDPRTAEPVYLVLKNDFAQDPAELGYIFVSRFNELLKFLNNERTTDLLLLYAKEPSAESRAIATQQLGLIEDARAIPALGDASRDPDPEIRRAAAAGLVLTSDPRAIAILIGMLTDSDDEIVRRIAEGLGLKGDQHSVDPIIALLHHKSVQVRYESVLALVKLQTPAADDALLEVLKNSSSTTNERDWAAKRLCEANDQRALSDLQVLYEEERKAFGVHFAPTDLQSCIQRLSAKSRN